MRGPTQQPPGESSRAWAFEQLIELERERVASNNRRLDVAEKVIAAAGEAVDQRQHDYHVERLRRSSTDRNARHWAFMKLVWAAAIGSATFGAVQNSRAGGTDPFGFCDRS